MSIASAAAFVAKSFPNGSQGDKCTLEAWNAVLPDPRAPGKFRLVHFAIEMRMELVADDVDQYGETIKSSAPQAQRIA